MSPVASSTDEELFAPYQLIGELGSRPSPVYVVRDVALGGKPKLLVAERFAGVLDATDGPGALFASEARRISTLASPTVARVRQLDVRGDDLVVFWYFLDGEKLGETWLSSMPLEVALRVILDVLSGLAAIHGLKDAKHQPMQLVHGEVSTATIVVGVDGVARILHPIARRLPGGASEEASLGYLAPEVHAGSACDARADVFGAGVLLWEALSGKRLFSESGAAAIIEQTRRGVAPAVVPDKAAWAKGLVQVAAKALAWSPDGRWPTAAAMAAEVRKVAGLKLASAIAAATFAQGTMGERVRARRERLESAGIVSRQAPPPKEEEERPTVAVPVALPVATAEEVGAEADVELLPETVPPPALSPPPLPPRALHDSQPAGEDEIAIDVPFSIAPPPVDAFEVSPTSVEQPYEVEPAHRSGRRRTAAVLGGVVAVGIVVFALAGWRAAQRSAAPPATRIPLAETVAVQAVRPEAPPAVPAPPAPEPSSDLVPVPSPTTIAPPLESTPTPTPTQSSSAAPLPKISASPLPRPKPPSSRFDPNSL